MATVTHALGSFWLEAALPNRWPEIGSLRKTIPARGLFAHHVKGITLHNVGFIRTNCEAERIAGLMAATPNPTNG